MELQCLVGVFSYPSMLSTKIVSILFTCHHFALHLYVIDLSQVLEKVI